MNHVHRLRPLAQELARRLIETDATLHGLAAECGTSHVTIARLVAPHCTAGQRREANTRKASAAFARTKAAEDAVKYAAVDWVLNDAEIARQMGEPKEKIRLARVRLGLPPSPCRHRKRGVAEVAAASRLMFDRAARSFAADVAGELREQKRRNGELPPRLVGDVTPPPGPELSKGRRNVLAFIEQLGRAYA